MRRCSMGSPRPCVLEGGREAFRSLPPVAAGALERCRRRGRRARLESQGVSGGTDISFLSGLRVPCAILLALFLGLLVLIGSCIVSNWS